ncbi:unnamed protein product [Nippostrongylus brasiliensis]|uniref:PUM-HD domain-containing protein n=1 Tax=Nippostrongylus brasiliensis TaxID=27835 RepID=A0A0N4XHX2_NIPBR|nr:unnamed protein product [Nippostrongylus brasiliensis]
MSLSRPQEDDSVTRCVNSMFHVVSGYGLARRLNRQLYFLIKHDDEGTKFENYLDRIVEAFPRLVDSNVLGYVCANKR